MKGKFTIVRQYAAKDGRKVIVRAPILNPDEQCRRESRFTKILADLARHRRGAT